MTRWRCASPNIMQAVFITLATLELRIRPHDQMEKSNIMKSGSLSPYSTHATSDTVVNA